MIIRERLKINDIFHFSLCFGVNDVLRCMRSTRHRFLVLVSHAKALVSLAKVIFKKKNLNSAAKIDCHMSVRPTAEKRNREI